LKNSTNIVIVKIIEELKTKKQLLSRNSHIWDMAFKVLFPQRTNRKKIGNNLQFQLHLKTLWICCKNLIMYSPNDDSIFAKCDFCYYLFKRFNFKIWFRLELLE